LVLLAAISAAADIAAASFTGSSAIILAFQFSIFWFSLAAAVDATVPGDNILLMLPDHLQSMLRVLFLLSLAIMTIMLL
jgi:hypothetical protein